MYFESNYWENHRSLSERCHIARKHYLCPLHQLFSIWNSSVKFLHICSIKMTALRGCHRWPLGAGHGGSFGSFLINKLNLPCCMLTIRKHISFFYLKIKSKFFSLSNIQSISKLPHFF